LGINGGPLVSNQVCDIPDLGKAWFNKDSIVIWEKRKHFWCMPNKIVLFSRATVSQQKISIGQQRRLGLMLQQSSARLQEQTWHQLSVIWWKYQINI